MIEGRNGSGAELIIVGVRNALHLLIEHLVFHDLKQQVCELLVRYVIVAKANFLCVLEQILHREDNLGVCVGPHWSVHQRE